MYLSAVRIDCATSSARSACSTRWLTAPMQIFFGSFPLYDSNSSMSAKLRSFVSIVQTSPVIS
jgi:hypothetical protein